MTILEAITAQPRKKANVTVDLETPRSPYAAGSNSEMHTYVIMPVDARGASTEAKVGRFFYVVSCGGTDRRGSTHVTLI